MKRSVLPLIVTALLSRACFGQVFTAVTPSNLDVGQGLAVTIACSNNGSFLCPQLQSWRICDTVKRVYFQHGDSIVEPSAISTIDSSIVALVGFPLSSPPGAWDVVVEHKPADSSITTTQKMVKTGGFTLNALTSPVIDSIRPAAVFQNRAVEFDLYGSHTHFKIARQGGTLANNITTVTLTRGTSSIKADSVAIESCIKATAYFTLKNSADTGLFVLRIEQGNALPVVEVEKSVTIKNPPSSPYSLPAGCMAFYPFEGDAADRSYNGNNGTITNALSVDGIVGQALYFNGHNSVVSVPNSTSLTAKNGLSIAAWVKTEFDSVNYTWLHIISKDSYNWNLIIDLSQGVSFRLNGNDYNAELVSSTNAGLNYNEWNHIVATWDGAVMRCYINGVKLPVETAFATPIDTTTGALTIGSNTDGFPFRGIIDEVMLFNRGLSAAEADSIYKGMYFEASQSGSAVPAIIPSLPKVTLQLRPEFTWHPVTGATSYTLSIATNSSFSSAIFQVPLSDTVFIPPVNLPIGPIYWHVKSDEGLRWSTTDRFVIQPNTIPFIVRFSGASVNSRRPTFSWNKIDLSTTYKIEVAANPLFITPYLTALVSDTKFTPLGDMKTGKSYWRVSCDRNLALFCEPDSLVINATALTTDKNQVAPSENLFVRTTKTGLLINYELAKASPVSIKVYSLQGKLMQELNVARKLPGRHETSVNVRGLSKGYYLLDFSAGSYHRSKRVANY